MKLNRTVAPPIKDAIDFEIVLPACEKHTLSNGVEVYALNMGSEDTLMVNWVFYGGTWYEPKKAVAPATNYLLKNGTSGRNAFAINEHFEYYGAYLNRACYSETSELNLHCLNKHVHALLPVVAELLTDAVFPEEELSIYQQNSQQRLKVNLQKSEFVAGRLIDAYLYGEKHPYGKYNNAEDYTALQREDLLAFYDAHYRNGRCVIFVAGKLPNDLVSELEKYFGNLPLRNHRFAPENISYLVEPALEKKQRIINDPDGVQAAIRIARPFPNRHHPDFQKAQVLNNVFGGFFGSRLMGNIREDKGYTYGIYSYLLNYVHESGWMISTEAGRDVSEATVAEIYKEMALLRDEEVDEEELMMTRNFIIGSVLGDLDGPFQVIGRWKNLLLNGLDEQYFYNSLDVIRHIKAAELRELANRYLQPDDFYELVVV
ncbi:MAG: pitrilysin family protein [Candidatus Pseudobacter hemicellulosilyticus]|uniref:Pitrilysin family protein n=1 Tax=Candidatus Pseudobacter hemicellulosilyticus TaxID=3121375 RepID=A0AAJ6BI10_9BACT|nr:MAG: pitrilysin family protein [Pseudobacter sp.]